MKLWAIRRNDADYDEHDVFIIRAETEQDARTIAIDNCPSNCVKSFMSPEISRCTELKSEGTPGILFSAMIGCGWEEVISVTWREPWLNRVAFNKEKE